jgi:hypothetical protein
LISYKEAIRKRAKDQKAQDQSERLRRNSSFGPASFYFTILLFTGLPDPCFADPVI